MNVLSNSKPKARKEHRCDFCYDKINKGEVYDSQVCVYDNIYNWKTHARCSEIASELNMYDDYNDGVTGDDFCDDIRQEYINLKDAIDPMFHKKEGFKYPPFKEQLDYVCKMKLT